MAADGFAQAPRIWFAKFMRCAVVSSHRFRESVGVARSSIVDHRAC